MSRNQHAKSASYGELKMLNDIAQRHPGTTAVLLGRRRSKSSPVRGGFLGRTRRHHPDRDRPEHLLGLEYRYRPDRTNSVPAETVIEIIKSCKLSPHTVDAIHTLLLRTLSSVAPRAV